MVESILNAIGVPNTPPTNLAELIPYLLTVLVGLGLVIWIFKFFRYWAVQVFGKGAGLR